MDKADESYAKSTKEWLNEQKIRIEDCQHTIETSKKIIESNEKQIELLKETTNYAIENFNAWAEKNGAEKLELLP